MSDKKLKGTRRDRLRNIFAFRKQRGNLDETMNVVPSVYSGSMRIDSVYLEPHRFSEWKLP